MKNNITELVFILDRSGSMAGLESDTIGGFNSLIEKQRKQDGECYVSTILFDHVSEVLHDRVKLSEINKLTENDYTVRGATALIDAIGGAIHHIGNVHKYARRYSSNKVKRMIEHEKEKYGWEFLFIGANIDSVETARHFGIGADRSVNYHADSQGTAVVFETVSETVCNMRANVPLAPSWSDNINKDYNGRKR